MLLTAISLLPPGLSAPFKGLGLMAYEEALEIQKSEAARVIAGTSPGTIFFVEHPPTFTAGRRTDNAERPTDGTPVVDVDRGGKITWHGPGQLVCYPIIALAEKFDVVGYVRLLEEMMMAALADLGADTIQIPGRSGVWLPASAQVASPPTALPLTVILIFHGLIALSLVASRMRESPRFRANSTEMSLSMNCSLLSRSALLNFCHE